MEREEERRQGMAEFDKRLQRVESIVLAELGDPTSGKEGRLHRRLHGMEETLDGIDGAIRGNGEPGLTERVRGLEDFKRAGRRGDMSLIDRLQQLEFKFWLLVTALAAVAGVVGKIAWEMFRARYLGGG